MKHKRIYQQYLIIFSSGFVFLLFKTFCMIEEHTDCFFSYYDGLKHFKTRDTFTCRCKNETITKDVSQKSVKVSMNVLSYASAHVNIVISFVIRKKVKKTCTICVRTIKYKHKAYFSFRLLTIK